MTSALFLISFDISMNQTRTSPLPSKVLLASILEIMIKSFKYYSENYITLGFHRATLCLGFHRAPANHI